MDNTTYTDTLAAAIQVRASISRSVHIERDLDQAAVANSYVLTGQARRSLSRIVEQIHSATPVRAWTLTGPYGSGKSLFGLFLMNLTCGGCAGHAYATAQLATVDGALADTVRAAACLDHSFGLLPVPISGYRASLHECIQIGLRHVLEHLADQPEIQALLAQAALWEAGASSRTVLRGIEQLLHILRSAAIGYQGILLIFDELGKPLEFSAGHADQGDIFLLQELAELAARSGDTPLIFVGILHQGFDRYAGQLDPVSQREWAKVQGRFEDIPFQEPPNQQLALLVDALQVQAGATTPAVEAMLAANAAAAVAGKWCPPLMKLADFEQLCRRAFPFHPSALVSLPYIFRRLAQNERSLFAYLTSLEPLAFQEFLTTQRWPRLVRLPDLFDYLAANYQGRLYASLRARPLTEALERLQTSADLDAAAVAVVKTIAMLTWLADSGPFAATETSVLFALTGDDYDEEELRTTLRLLKQRSAIVFRRFNGTYAIWQGSDVDLDAQVEQAEQRLAGVFSLAQAVQDYLPPQPIVARRHSYLTGTVRPFEVRYVDALTRDHLSLQPAGGASGLVLLCLSSNGVEAEAFTDWAQSALLRGRTDIVVGVAQRTARLAELLNALRCLHWVGEHTPELRDDPVARRELRERINGLESVIRHEMDSSLSLHRLADAAGCRWFWQGAEVHSGARRSLSHLLSNVADEMYPATPCIRNELINRRMLSSQGAAARRNLIEAMLSRSSEARLGIEGFPPERSMYESVLRTGKLHQEVAEGEWALLAPAADDPLFLRPAWDAISEYVFALPPEPRGVQELFARLNQSPYGVTEGVLPVLLCAFLQVHHEEATLYSEGTLLPLPQVADWEVLLRRPELFTVAGCRVVGPRLVVVERLARGLGVPSAAMPIVRKLIGQIKSLPEHVLRTQKLSARTLAVRRAIDAARSPENLLFHALPQAVGVEPFGETLALDSDQVEQFFAGLNGALQELAGVMPKVLAEARDQLLLACGFPAGDEGWQQFMRVAEELWPKINQPTLTTLLRRASDAPDTRVALESTLAYVVNRPARSWSDSDREQFMTKAQSYGELFRRERNGYVTYAVLTPSQKERSRRLAADLRERLQGDLSSDAMAVRAALQTLLEELQSSPEYKNTEGTNSYDRR